MRLRPLLPPAVTVVGGLLILLSAFHCYTAGFGLLQEVTHRGVHLAFVLGLITLVFPHHHALLRAAPQHRLASPGGVPWFDGPLALGIAASEAERMSSVAEQRAKTRPIQESVGLGVGPAPGRVSVPA